MLVRELETPAVVIDLDIVDHNLRRMESYCSDHGIHLRPHTKTHKIPEIARMQIASGARGIVVAKPSEAQVMVDAGLTDVMVAYPIVTEWKARVLAELATRASVTVSLDSLEAARCLSVSAAHYGISLRIMCELDVGFQRCGVPTGDACVSLARKLFELPGLAFDGVMFYPGHMLTTPNEQVKLLERVNAKLDDCYEAFAAAGIQLPAVSGGSTPTAYRSHAFHGVTEIRPGMYIFNDRNMLAAEVCGLDECALTVHVTVVSTAVSGKAIVDGGSKTFSSDRLLAGDGNGYGMVLEDGDAVFAAVSEEHGHIDTSRSSRVYRVGERLTILPNHVCSTINMHDHVFGARKEIVELTFRVAGRGKVQ